MNRKFFFFTFLFLNLFFIHAQDVHSGSKITSSKIVIGFPQVSDQQLDDIKSIYLNQPEVSSAVFYKGNNYCMLVQLTQGQTKFSVFDEFIKLVHTVYDVTRCYVKPTGAFDEIIANTLPGTEIIIK